jgi:hypothetical protein
MIGLHTVEVVAATAVSFAGRVAVAAVVHKTAAHNAEIALHTFDEFFIFNTSLIIQNKGISHFIVTVP